MKKHQAALATVAARIARERDRGNEEESGDYWFGLDVALAIVRTYARSTCGETFEAMLPAPSLSAAARAARAHVSRAEDGSE